MNTVKNSKHLQPPSPSILKFKIIESSQRNETVQKAWNDICIKSPHPNLLICPKQENKLFFTQDKKAKECSDFLRYFNYVHLGVSFKTLLFQKRKEKVDEEEEKWKERRKRKEEKLKETKQIT